MTPTKKTAKPVKKTTAPVKKTAKKSVKKAADRNMAPDVVGIINMLGAIPGALERVFGTQPSLTPAQRRRLQGAGIRRYGFISKTLEISESKMQYSPRTFDRDALRRMVTAIDGLRSIIVTARQVIDIAEDYLFQESDDAFRAALIYYNTVRDLARHGDVGAKEVFAVLAPFFARRARTRAEEDVPTQKQAIRDAKAIIRGGKDGEVLIKGKRRAVVRKELEVLDETGRPRGGVKITERE